MTAAIMQPYFLPYIGYFQLISAVDLFVMYDNIQYTKSGWINRNRLLRGGEAATFSLPLKGASDYLDIRDRELADSFSRPKLLRQFISAYRRAPHFEPTFALIEGIVGYQETNLFRFLEHSLIATCAHLGVETEIIRSSSISIDHDLAGQDRVIAICRAVGAGTYINAIGGVGLYSEGDFRNWGIDLRFLKSSSAAYPQGGGEFVPRLSIIDVLMFNSLDQVQRRIQTEYELL